MIPNDALTKAGVLPIKSGAVRFAVGPPTGLTSNTWRLWATTTGDIYIACRDNFKEAKVSLHASGRWRIGFTREAVAKNIKLLPFEQNRAWEVWDQPPPTLADSIIAFRLIFPTSELAVRPEQRAANTWENVAFIEPGPPGKMTVLTLFITIGEVILRHETEPSFCLASLDIGLGRRAQLVAHGEPEADWSDVIEKNVAQARNQAEQAGIDIPPESYAYFFGHQHDGSRFIFGARLSRFVQTE